MTERSFINHGEVDRYINMSLEYINKILAALTIASHVFLATAVLGMFFQKTRNFILNTLGRHGMLLTFVVAVAATSLSLFYSEVVGFEPCKLCWLQRIFMYPQVVLLGIGLARKDYKIIDYSLALAVIGAVVALYHNYIYFGGASIFPCSAFGLGVSCTRRYVFEFGYVTIPLMSLTSFLLAIFFLNAQKLYNKFK